MDPQLNRRPKEGERLVWDAVQVQRLLQLSRGAVYKALSTGEIPSLRIGRRILIPAARLEAIIAGPASIGERMARPKEVTDDETTGS